jgi:hypothetical protein
MAVPIPGVAGAPTYYFKDKKGIRTPAPEAGQGITPKGVSSDATQYADYTYEDGTVQTYKYVPGKQPPDDWVAEGPRRLPPNNKEIADAWNAKVKAAEEADEKQRQREAPRVLEGATSKEPKIPIFDPKTGKVTSQDNPAYQSPADRDAQLSTEERARLEAQADASRASAEASRASTAKTKAETDRAAADAADKAKRGGMTAAESANDIIQRRQQEWKEYTDTVRQKIEAGEMKFKEADALLKAEHNRISLQIQSDQNKLAQRGQDVTSRGQSLDFASEMGRMGVAMLPYMGDPAVTRNIQKLVDHTGNPTAPRPDLEQPSGVLQGMSPMDFVNAALQGISPGAGPAPPGQFVAPPAAPQPLGLTQVSPQSQAPAPSFGPIAPTAPPGPMPPPMAGAAITAPQATTDQEEIRRRLAAGYPM